MGYKLKQSCPAYSPVDGECAGRRYEHGVEYAEIPIGDADNFDSTDAEIKPLADFGRRKKQDDKETEQ